MHFFNSCVRIYIGEISRVELLSQGNFTITVSGLFKNYIKQHFYQPTTTAHFLVSHDDIRLKFLANLLLGNDTL